MNEKTEDTYTRLALLLFGIMLGWEFETYINFSAFIISVFGLLILGVIHTIHSKLHSQKMA